MSCASQGTHCWGWQCATFLVHWPQTLKFSHISCVHSLNNLHSLFFIDTSSVTNKIYTYAEKFTRFTARYGNWAYIIRSPPLSSQGSALPTFHSDGHPLDCWPGTGGSKDWWIDGAAPKRRPKISKISISTVPAPSSSGLAPLPPLEPLVFCKTFVVYRKKCIVAVICNIALATSFIWIKWP